MKGKNKKSIALGLVTIILAGICVLIFMRDKLYMRNINGKVKRLTINSREENLENEESILNSPEQMTGSQMVKVIQSTQPAAAEYNTNSKVQSIADIENFDYILLVRSEMEYGASLLIPSYFLFAKEYYGLAEGEEAYLELQNQLLQKSFDERIWTSSFWQDMKQGLIDNGYEKRLEEEILIDISTDGEQYLTFQCADIDEPWNGTVCVYDGITSKKINEWERINYRDICVFSDSCFGAYIQRGQDNGDSFVIHMDGNNREKLFIEDLAAKYKNIILNEDGTYFAAIQDGNIVIYNIEGGSAEFGFTGIELLEQDCMVLHQFRGDAERGFILFSSGIRTYKLTYPDKRVEVLGDYVFYPSISPDESYLFYTGISDSVREDFEWEEELMKIPQAVYIKELDTGKVYGMGTFREGWNICEYGVRWIERCENDQ